MYLYVHFILQCVSLSLSSSYSVYLYVTDKKVSVREYVCVCVCIFASAFFNVIVCVMFECLCVNIYVYCGVRAVISHGVLFAALCGVGLCGRRRQAGCMMACRRVMTGCTLDGPWERG